MYNREHGLDTAADVLKQLVTLSTAIIAASLALLLAHKTSSATRWLPLTASIFGGLCILSSLFLLTDLAAVALGSTEHTTKARYRWFVASWAFFFGCIAFAGVYVALLALN